MKELLFNQLLAIAAVNPAGFTVDAVTLEPITSGYAVAVAATQNSFGESGLNNVIDHVMNHPEINAFGDIKVIREQSSETKAEMQAVITEIKPEAAAADGERLAWTDDELQAIGDHYGITFDHAVMQENDVYGCTHSLYTIMRVLCGLVSFYKPQDKPQASEATNESAENTRRGRSHENCDSEDAPHESLSLKTMAGGVYVDGSSRATYFNRRQIKAHGATWNKINQRWEATTPEAIAKLREWFGLTA